MANYGQYFASFHKLEYILFAKNRDFTVKFYEPTFLVLLNILYWRIVASILPYFLKIEYIVFAKKIGILL
jgi:hypothetical protein